MNQNRERELLKQAELISNFGTWELDIQTQQIYWSDGVFLMLGYQPQEFEIDFEKGLSFIHPDDREMYIAATQETLKSGIEYSTKKRFITKNKEIKIILSKGKLIKDKDGRYIKLYGLFQDITTQEEIAQQLQESLEKLKSRNEFIETILQNLPIGIAVNKIDDGTSTLINKHFASSYGWQDEDLTDVKTFFEKVYPDETYRNKIMGQIMADIQSGDPERMNWRNIKVTTATGSEKIVDAKNIPLYNQNLMISTVVDVTQNVRLIEDKIAQEADLEALIENTPDIIYSVDMNFKLLTYNSVFDKFMRLVRKAKVKRGINVFELYSDKKKDLYLSIFKKVSEGNRHIFEDVVEFNDEKFYYEVAVNPIINEASKQIGISIFSKNITEQKSIEAAKEKAVKELENIMDSSLDIICTIDNNNQFVKLNKASEKVWGYKPEELVGKNYNILVHQDDLHLTNKTTEKILDGNNVFNFENRNLKKDGTIIPMIWSAHYDEQTQLTYCIAKDATEIKQAEEKLKLSAQYFKNLVQEGSDLIGILDIEGNYKYVSPTSLSILGILPEDFIGKNAFTFIHPADLEITLQNFNALLTQKRIKIAPFRFKSADGSWRWIETIATNLLDDPAINGIVVNSRDITEQKQKDRALERTNNILKNAQRITKIGNWEYNIATEELFWSDGVFQIFDIQNERNKILSFNDFAQFVHPADLPALIIAKKDAEKNGTPIELQHRIITKNKEEKYVRELAERVFNEDTQSYWLMGTIRDNTLAITGQQKIELSEKKYKYLFENNPAPMFIFKFETLQIIDCNLEASMLYGYTREEFLKLTIRDIRPPEDIEKINVATINEETYGQIHKDAWRHQKKNGEIILIDISAHILDYDDERCSLVQISDVTEKIKAQEALKKSDEKYKHLFKNSPTAMYLFDFETLQIIDCNDEILEQYGYTREEFLKLKVTDIRPAEDKAEIKKITKDQSTYGTTHKGIYRHLKKNGEIINVDITSHLIDYENRKSSLVQAIDITEKLKAEAELKKSEEDYKLLFQNSPLPKWIYDVETLKIVDVNQTALVKYGYNREEFLSMTILDVRLHQSEQKIKDIKNKVKNSIGNIHFGVFTHQTKNNTLIKVEVIGNKFTYKNRECILAVYNDVTEREEALKQLKVREQELSAAQKLSKLGNWSFDVKTNKFNWSDELFRIYEIDYQTFLENQNNLLYLIDEQDRERAQKISENIKKTGDNFSTEYGITTASGQKKIIQEIGYGEKDDHGNLIRIFGTAQDITERKKTEELIKESNQRFSYVSKATFDAIWDWDLSIDEIYWGEGFQQIFGHEIASQKTDSTWWTDLIHPDDLDRVYNGILSVIESKQENWIDEYRFLKANGAYAYVQDKGLVIRNADNKAIRMVGAMQDITKKKEEDLRLKLLESVIINTNDAVLITEAEPFDEGGPKIIYVNDAFTKMTGYQPEEIIGKTPRILQGPKSDFKELKRLGEAIRKWESCEITTINYKKNGEEFYINFSVCPIADEKGWFTHWIAIERDVTEKVLAQKQLESIFDERNTILESIGDAFFALDHHWTVTYWNYQAEKMLKVPKQKILGKNLWEVFGSRIDSLSHKKYNEAILRNKVINFEDYYPEQDKWYEISAYPSKSGLSVYFKDITERKQIQQQFQSVISNMPGITYRCKMDEYWTMVFMSDGVFDITGYHAEEFMNNKDRTFAAIIHPDDLMTTYNIQTKLFNHEVFDIEYRIICANGKIKWVEDKGRGVYGNQNELLFIDGVIMDITDRKNKEEEIKKAYEEKNDVLESIDDGFFAIDKNSLVTYWNQKAEILLGEKKEQVLGRNIHDMYNNPDSVVFYNHYQMAIKENRTVHFEAFSHRSQKWFEVSAFASDRGLSVYFKDVTQRKNAEIKLLQLNQILLKQTKELAISNQELEQFAYVASHDLQEPLRMITGFLTQIEKKYVDIIDDKGKQYIYFAVDGAKRMRQIILDLLEFSRVGRKQDDLELVNVNDTLHEVKLLFRKQIEDLGAKIIAKNLPKIESFATPLRQVLQNLIGNALKYHQKDIPPIIKIRAVEQPKYWQFEVNDNGIGIDEEYFKKIFIIFQRLHHKDEFEGTGMGLAICKKIIENLGGEIWVESEEGKGSTFYFTIKKTRLN